MLKKGNNIFSLLIIILSIFMTSSINIVKAADGTTNWGDQFITKVQLQNADGSPISTSNTDARNMSATWEFSTGNNVVKKGDTITVKVPEQFAVAGAKDADVMETDATNPQVLGTSHLDVDTRTITVTFNDYAANKSKTSPVKGQFWLKQLGWDVNHVTTGDQKLDWITQGTASQDNTSTGSVNIEPSIPDQNETLSKYGGIDHDTVRWTARINYKGESLPNATYKDILGPNQTLLVDDTHPVSIKSGVFDHDTGKITYDSPNLMEGKSIVETKDSDGNTNGFTIDLGNIDHSIMLEYSTKITNYDNLSNAYGNTGVLSSNQKVINTNTGNVFTNILGSDAGYSDIVSVTGHKLWDVPAGTTIPDNVQIDLMANGTDTGKSVTVSSSNDWYYEFDNLSEYDTSGKKITYTVKEDKVPDGFQSLPSSTNYDITNTLSQIIVKKAWQDGNNPNRPKSVIVNVYDGNGNGLSNVKPVTLDNSNEWTTTFSNLPNDRRWYLSEIGSNGNIDFKTPEGYIESQKYINNNPYNIILTNTLATSLTVNKKWVENNVDQKEHSGSIQIQLYANDNGQGNKKLGDPITLNNENNWTHIFGQNIDKPTAEDSSTNQLPKYDIDGNEIVYTAQEITPSDGYKTTYLYNTDKTKETITNTLKTTTPTDDKTKFTVVKKWENGKNTNPPKSIQVQLYDNDGKDAIGDPVTLTSSTNTDENWTHTWTGLDATKTYSVKEVDHPSNYTSSQSQTDNTVTITNTYHDSGSTNPPTDDKTHLKVTKYWRDNNNKDGKRPNSVTVDLYNGTQKVDSTTLNADNSWSYDFTNLDKNGQYTVREEPVSGYTSNSEQISSTNVNIYNTLTNTSTGDILKTITVNKHWHDNNNRDNKRPNSVKVNLLKNGNIIQSATLTSLNGWSYDFTGLNKNDQYTVAEVPVEGYTTTTSTNGNIVTITNTRTPTKTPDNPGNPSTPVNPDNPSNPGSSTGTPSGSNTPGSSTAIPGGNDTTTSFTPSNPMIPSVPYSNKTTNNNSNLLPQTGSVTNIIYTIIGFIILTILTTCLIRRKLV
ncbi:Cna B-type domain-containing protein [Companilactobacillus musae]|uniref:Cna B-type domain-containing protein n=2 Tax=Companilactobacillus musae TaxID=1903258 RepID=UPI000E6489B5|nr:Cna B-type domain-containing protein [Companilactobacillus musae]